MIFIFLSSDYFLIDWLYKTGNFNAGHLTSALMVEGYYDNYNFSADKLSQYSSYIQNRKDSMVKLSSGKCRWEFAFTPSIGFLGNPDELLTDCELKLSFDRADPYTSLFRMAEGEEYEKAIDLIDVYAITEYVSSPDLREKFSSLDIQPYSYQFDDCDVLGSVRTS